MKTDRELIDFLISLSDDAIANMPGYPDSNFYFPFVGKDGRHHKAEVIHKAKGRANVIVSYPLFGRDYKVVHLTTTIDEDGRILGRRYEKPNSRTLNTVRKDLDERGNIIRRKK